MSLQLEISILAYKKNTRDNCLLFNIFMHLLSKTYGNEIIAMTQGLVYKTCTCGSPTCANVDLGVEKV